MKTIEVDYFIFGHMVVIQDQETVYLEDEFGCTNTFWNDGTFWIFTQVNHFCTAIVPLYYDQVIRFVQNDVVGFESNAMNLLELKSVSKA